MQNEENDISRAVILFFGANLPHHSSPGAGRLLEEFGETRGAELELRVRTLWEEIGRIEVDWSTHTLVAGGELAATEMRARHPDLSPAAIKTLTNRFAFEWR